MSVSPSERGFARAITTTLVGLLLTAASARAQNVDSLRKRFALPLIPTVEVASSVSRSAPGSSSSSPSAFGANWGDGFIGASYQSRVRFDTKNDGVIAAGFGLGNARDFVGAEVTVTSVSTFRRGFGKGGTVSARLHRSFEGGMGASVGVENGASWGITDGGRSVFAVVSKVFRLREVEGDPFGNVTVNVGAGNGRFRREADVRAGRETINPFASVGVRVAEPLAVIADWTGQDLALGLSIAPFRYIPIVISPTLSDVTRSAGDGPRFTIGVGAGFKFGGIRNIFGGGSD